MIMINDRWKLKEELEKERKEKENLKLRLVFTSRF